MYVPRCHGMAVSKVTFLQLIHNCTRESWYSIGRDIYIFSLHFPGHGEGELFVYTNNVEFVQGLVFYCANYGFSVRILKSRGFKFLDLRSHENI